MNLDRKHRALLAGRIPSLQHTAAIIALSLFLCGAAFAEQTTASNAPAIPPGQEELLLDMLGRGAMLPGCDLVDGQIKYTVVVASYACLNGEVKYQLSHRSEAPPQSTATDQFAVMLTSGQPPNGFTDALVARIRSREADFEWVWPDAAQ